MLTLLFLATACLANNIGGAPTPTLQAAVPPTATPGLPDLAVQSVYLSSIEPYNRQCSPPESLYRLHLTVINRGAAASGPFSLRVNAMVRELPAGLAPGQSIDLLLPFQTTQTEIRVDSSSQAIESDETNNLFSETLSLPPLPAVCQVTPTPAVQLRAPLVELEGHTAAVRAVVFSPDGKLIASGSVDDTMRLWTAAPAGPLRVMNGHTFPIICLKFTPNGAQLISGSMDGLIRIWRVSNSALINTLQGHAGWVRALDVSSDGQYLVSGSDDYTLRIWRVSNGGLMQTIDEGMTSINQVAFAPNSTNFAWAEESGEISVRTIKGSRLLTLKDTAVSANDLAFLPDDRLIAGYGDGSVRTWSLKDGALLEADKIGARAITALAVSRDGRWLVAAQEDDTLSLWEIEKDLAAGVPTVLYTGVQGHIDDVDFSPLGNLIVSASSAGVLQVWEVPQAAAP